MAAAFAGGSLLYVASVDLLPIIHSQGKRKLAAVTMFLIGCIAMTGVKALERGHDHHGRESAEEHTLHDGEYHN